MSMDTKLSGVWMPLVLVAAIAQGCGGDGDATSSAGAGNGTTSGGSGGDGASAGAGGAGASMTSGGGGATGGGGSTSTGGSGGGSGGDAGGGGEAGGGGSASGCVGPSGVQVGPVKVSEESRAYYPVAIKASDTALAVAWNHYYQQSTSEIRMRLIDRQTLQPLPGDPEILAAGALYSHGIIRLVPSPAGFALSYLRSFYTTGETYCAARMFDGTGTSIGYTFDATVGDVGCSHPSMVHDGAGWGYFHLGGGGIRLRFLEDDGDMLSFQVVDTVAGGNGATSGFNPITQRYVAVYTQGFPGGDEEIVTAEINLAGTVLASGVRVSNAPGYSRFPEVVWSGSGFGAVWDDNRSGSAETYFSQLDGTGAPVGPEVAVVTDGYGTRIASSGQAYGLVWRTNTGELHFKAIDLAGNDLGTEHTLAIDLPSHTVGPSVTWDGERFVVVWFQNTQGVATEEIFAAAVCP